MSAVLDEPAQIASARAADARLAGADWSAVAAALDARGVGVVASVLRPEECTALIDLYAEEARFRSRVVMSRHGFGQGEYRYFDYPLPATVASLRAALYPHLASVANRCFIRTT